MNTAPPPLTLEQRILIALLDQRPHLTMIQALDLLSAYKKRDYVREANIQWTAPYSRDAVVAGSILVALTAAADEMEQAHDA